MTNEFFNEAFKGYEIPDNLKNASITICKQFDIKGICDPAYIVNVIAFETGLGDGQFNFYENEISNDDIKRVSKRLTGSYGCNIDSSEIVENILIENLI